MIIEKEMKNLVIYTQISENYGAHDWDGTGVCPQYWKNKGGNTYVFEELTPYRERKVCEHGIPTIKRVIEKSSEEFTEHVVGFSILEKEIEYAESWESVYKLEYGNNAWKSFRV